MLRRLNQKVPICLRFLGDFGRPLLWVLVQNSAIYPGARLGFIQSEFVPVDRILVNLGILRHLSSRRQGLVLWVLELALGEVTTRDVLQLPNSIGVDLQQWLLFDPVNRLLEGP